MNNVVLSKSMPWIIFILSVSLYAPSHHTVRSHGTTNDNLIINSMASRENAGLMNGSWMLLKICLNENSHRYWMSRNCQLQSIVPLRALPTSSFNHFHFAFGHSDSIKCERTSNVDLTRIRHSVSDAYDHYYLHATLRHIITMNMPPYTTDNEKAKNNWTLQ